VYEVITFPLEQILVAVVVTGGIMAVIALGLRGRGGH